MRSLLLAIFIVLTAQVAVAAPNPQIEQGGRVRAIAKTLSVPANWRFIVVDEIQWKSITQKSGTTLESHSAVSNLKAGVTFIRVGYAAAATDYLLRRTIAHEMGHARCQCTNESTADRIADQLTQDLQ